ncbi:hypothetical protein POTOM_045508 [Populus tomentosa]|uniref:Uncharacterized protein n=1 Tax=Populus tomentosa TaxID=118781 RepID=A0A8X7YHX7_POPTO|nr:hypothetical protein POTOM_045508 [Populus tomentosa]
MNLLGGLGSNYNAVVTAINIRDDKISVEAINSMLLAFENRLEQQSSVDQISAMVTNYASSSNNRGGGKRYNDSRGHSYANFNPNASNYNYRGHGRGGRYTQSGRHNAISSEKPQYDNWYLDSRASHNLTQNAENLSNFIPCTRIDKLAKSHRLPTYLSSSRASKPLELIHMDIWGPALANSIYGA